MANINSYGSCNSGFKGSGTLFCDKSYWGTLKAKALVPKGSFKFDITDGAVSITETEWDNKIKSNKLFPYIGLYDYDSTGNENGVNTSSTQVERTTQQGLVKLEWMYVDGNCRHASLYDKRGFQKWDLILIYANGIRIAHNFDKTEASAFDGGNFAVQTETIAKGDDLQTSSCSMQLLDPDEFNERNVFLTWEQLGFNALKKQGFNDVSIVLDAVASGETDLTVSVASSCNGDSLILGIDDIDRFRIKKTTVAGVSTIEIPNDVSYDVANNKYVVTSPNVTVSTDKIVIFTNDGTYDVIEDAEGIKYKGTSNTVTVS